MNEYLGWGLERLPTRNTIENWVLKSGYAIYQAPAKSYQQEDYAQIIDESMMLGSEKMVLSLGVRATKTMDIPLTHSDVDVLDISVAPRWNSQGIKQVFEKTLAKMGKPPLYIISDNDSKLKKAIGESNQIHIRDVGHTMALLVEHLYKNDPQFKAYAKQVGKVKIREVMRPTSYLLPPRQRSIARFLNLSSTITWSVRMLKIWPSLNAEEQKVFHFLTRHRSIIEELQAIFDYVDRTQQEIKSKGLSKKSIDFCLEVLEKQLTINNKRVEQFKQSVRKYFTEEADKLPGECVWNASSDVIESLFGSYKQKKSDNSLSGVTSYVLMLPLLTKVGCGKAVSKINFKQSLETVFMRDLKEWKTTNLTENQSIKRHVKLAA